MQKVTYTNFRNRLTNILRRVNSLYYTKLFLENAKNSKKVWDILNGLINRSSKNTLKELVVNNGRLRRDSLVNYINNYFINIAVTIRGQASQSSIFRCLAPSVSSSCFFPPTDLHEISVIIKPFCNKCSKMLDLYTSIIKENSAIMVNHMVIIYLWRLVSSRSPSKLLELPQLLNRGIWRMSITTDQSPLCQYYQSCLRGLH